MPWTARRAAAFVLLAFGVYLLYFHNLSGVGLIGPDEPRYAAIGREMASSGDWITPRLWGGPWFEKPPLAYWMTAAAFRLGWGGELAPRVPVALLAVAFLLFYWRVLRREFGAEAALAATAILATSAMWLGFSHAAVTDLPMTAFFSAAMLLALGWIERGERRWLWVAAALAGLAVLAKGLVPLALGAPVLWAGRGRLRDLLRPGPLVAFVLVAAPWYVTITAIHGRLFLDDFFLRHHLARFANDSLKHAQPFWFYVPVVAAALFPWFPLLGLLFRRTLYKDPRARFLLLWLVFGFVFLSTAANKLPGYVLPLVPAAAALAGISLAQARRKGVLVACALALALVPVVAAVLPVALRRGITHTSLAGVSWAAIALAAGLAAGVWAMLRRGRSGWAVVSVAAAVAAGVVWLESATFSILDRTISARPLWREAAERRDEVCVAEVNRGWRYSLNYYSEIPLPDCGTTPRRLRIVQPPGEAPYLERTSLRDF
ncbi:MAG TPA: glycosyltransferase family 39 protein [Bryobacteraceae bacterium]